MKNWLIVLIGVIILTGLVVSIGSVVLEPSITPVTISLRPDEKDLLNSVGINKVVWYQEKVLDENTICWAIISEPYIHKYNECLHKNTDMNKYVEKILNSIVLDINRTQTTPRITPNNQVYGTLIDKNQDSIKD